MVNENNSETQLAVLVDRNQRRQSLVINDEYEESSGSSEAQSDNEEVVEKILAQTQPHKASTSEDHERKEIITIDIPSKLNDSPDHIIKFIKSVKKQRYNRDGEFYSRFSDVKFRHSDAIFDNRKLQDSEFYGFFILFWLGVGVLMFNTFIKYTMEHGSILKSPIIRILTRDIVKVGLTDLMMYLSIFFSYFLQRLVARKLVNWDRYGWIIQNVYQFCYLMFYVWFASDHCMGFPWIAKVFLFLHSLVLLMKMHSYAFYNGYLWRIHNELKFSIARLQRSKDKGEKLKEEIENALNESIDFCKFELDCQSSSDVKFPDNITLNDFFMYSMFPTLVYAIDFPRTEKIRWSYVASKIVAIFGIIFLMVMVAQVWMYPIVLRAVSIKDLPFTEKLMLYPFLLLDMIPPFILQYLFQFYLIWDAILTSLAELTRFADREFYLNWWSCVDWSEFARDWNRPVHKFLLRHVYHSSISAFKLTKLQATFFTFLLSSVIHELAMFVIFGKLRGYLLLLQMSQIPLVIVSRSKWLRGRKKLGNAIFWMGILTGPSLMCTLYITF